MPAYTNSPLVVHTHLSPNMNSGRVNSYNSTGKITGIAIHHMAGNLTIETCGNVFAPASRGASSNYGIGSDGRVGMYVEEKNRSWATCSPWVDYNYITIEVANCSGDPDWRVSDKAYATLINLCTDICKRNGIDRLNYTGDKNGNLVMHKWYAATGCPGPYLSSKFADIAKKVNANLTAATKPPKEDPKVTYEEWCKFQKQYEAEQAKKKGAAWAEKALQYVYDENIMRGDKGTMESMRPQSSITRQEVAQITMNVIKRLEKEIDAK